MYESLRFASFYADAGETDLDRVLDQIVLLKIVPRIHGARRRVEPLLQALLKYAHDPSGAAEPPPQPRLVATHAKLERMLKVVETNQFVSFSE
jgi:hypothetical protein